ncbi:hypothetical protein [Methylopila turkensis]|uniref:hypothetical protein n=1 Tax=Methylopila turkensis TaxID=1437816 RepID=UPI0022F2C7C9|nr:hypothetical protein [Methylopila turkensis]
MDRDTRFTLLPPETIVWRMDVRFSLVMLTLAFDDERSPERPPSRVSAELSLRERSRSPDVVDRDRSSALPLSRAVPARSFARSGEVSVDRPLGSAALSSARDLRSEAPAGSDGDRLSGRAPEPDSDLAPPERSAPPARSEDAPPDSRLPPPEAPAPDEPPISRDSPALEPDAPPLSRAPPEEPPAPLDGLPLAPPAPLDAPDSMPAPPPERSDAPPLDCAMAPTGTIAIAMAATVFRRLDFIA